MCKKKQKNVKSTKSTKKWTSSLDAAIALVLFILASICCTVEIFTPDED